jgi:hypothetical protein
MRRIHIIGGGTVSHVRAHLALCAPAYGKTVGNLYSLLCEAVRQRGEEHDTEVKTHYTRMAGGNTNLETNEDVDRLVKQLIDKPETKMIFLPAALVDFDGAINGIAGSKTGLRLLSRDSEDHTIVLTPTSKIIGQIRKTRKDIFLVGFKTTTGATERVQYLSGLNLCKEASCNLVLANDLQTRVNMIVTPEEAAYCVTNDRIQALTALVDMAMHRGQLRFTHSHVIQGEPVSWHDEMVPQTLRTIVDHCIERGAYRPFRGWTAGHFAVKIDDKTFLTSRRRTNFNDMEYVGLVKVASDGPDCVIAYGSKPSVGGQSQRIIFKDYPEYDCIVHFHCPFKPDRVFDIPIKEQRLIECGSHECGQNTSSGLKRFGNLSAVMLDNHGPNIVFNRKIDPREVIDFIEANFDLDQKSGGYQL